MRWRADYDKGEIFIERLRVVVELGFDGWKDWLQIIACTHLMM